MIAIVCRGCCCGTLDKHPGTDHQHHVRVLAEAAAAFGVTSCLGQCRWSNVVVAVDERTGEQHWFARMLADADVVLVAAWLRAPDRAEYPEHLVRVPPRPDWLTATRVAAALVRRRHRVAQAAAAADQWKASQEDEGPARGPPVGSSAAVATR